MLKDDPTVRWLKKPDLDDVFRTWEGFKKKVEKDAKMKDILNGLGTLIYTYFIARDYDSVDCWGH
jgi:hypothetical protein